MNKNFKKILSGAIIFTLITPIFYPSYIVNAAVQSTNASTEAFVDDFNGDSLDQEKWLIAYKNWGGKDSSGKDYNGGVVPQNVSVSDGKLKLKGQGNNYEGDNLGINKDGSKRSDGKRVGAAIATKEYYSSGRYEVVAKVAPELGACSAIWTFEYEEYYPGDTKYKKMSVGGNDYYAVNHEIDIEMPGRPNSANVNQSFEYALCNTWTGENSSEYTTNYTKLPQTQNDGKFHKYRFDWHTGDDDETQRVEFYFDDVLVYTATKNIPTNASRLWIGLWFPNKWAGTPDFDTTMFEIDSVKITPFNESGDTPQAETFPNDGWATVPETPDTEDPSKQNPTNLVENGDFSEGSSKWNISGGTIITDKATLSSGNNTDTLTQTITVLGDTEYTLSADIVSNGTVLDFGVDDYNGRYTELKESVDSSGRKVIHFKTAKHITQIKIFFEVLRYQNSDSAVTVDNVVLVEGNQDSSNTGDLGSTENPTEPENPGEPEETDKNNLLTNGNFALGIEGWIKSGSAKVENGKAILTSGKDTDTLKQIIAVKPNTTYKLTADINSSGTVIDIGVKDYNGKYTDKSISYDKKSDGSLEFTTGSGIKEITVYLHVLRYQSISTPVEVDNVSLVEVN